jgi:hypothetical protein
VEGLQVGDQPPAPRTETPAPRAAQPASGDRRPRAGTENLPIHQRLMRVEAKLWPDQLRELTDLRREVMAARTEKAERITDNTLIRVAIELLLAHRDDLTGNTEAELRASVLPEQTG